MMLEGKNENKAKLKMLSAMALFGTIGIFVRYIELPSSIIALARWFIGTIFLLLLVQLQGRGVDRTAVKANFKLLCISGACVGFNWILLFEAYRYTTVATATLSYYMAPVFVMLASPFVVGERLSALKGFCVAMALGGMVLVSGFVQGGSEGVTITGILYGLGAAGLYAIVVLLNKFIHNIDGYALTIMQLGTAAIVLLPYTLVTENFSAMSMDTASLLLLAFVGIVHTGFNYSLYFSSLQELQAQTAALLSYIDPVVAIVLSTVLLGEQMDWLSGLGAVMVLGSTLLQELWGRRM